MKPPKVEDFILPRRKAASQIIGKLEKRKSLPFLTISGPSGCGKSDLANSVLLDRLKSKSGKNSLQGVVVSVDSDCTPLELALKIAETIIEHHPEFREKKSSASFREKILRSVARSPVEGGKKLGTMLRAGEKKAFKLGKIRIVIGIDGLDKLFENEVKYGSHPSIATRTRELGDLFDFLKPLIGRKTTLFSATLRSWIFDAFESALSEKLNAEENWLNYPLDYPDTRESGQLLGEVFDDLEIERDTDELKRECSATLAENPAFAGVVSDFIRENIFTAADQIGDEDDLAVAHLVRKADRLYLKQKSSWKVALQEMATRMRENPEGGLALREIAIAEDMWKPAMAFVENRIFAITGDGFKEAQILPVHHSLLDQWVRAISWSESERIVGISQMKEFDEKALTWELGDRTSDLLLSDEQALEDARVILRDSELSSQLSSLTRDYLTKSTRRRITLDPVLKKALTPFVSGLFGLVFIGILVVTVGSIENHLAARSEAAKAKSAETKSNLPSVSKTEVSALLASANKITDLTRNNEIAPLLSETELLPFANPQKIPTPIEARELTRKFETKPTSEPTTVVKTPAEIGGEKVSLPPVTIASTWEEILKTMGLRIAEADPGKFVDALAVLHEKTLAHPDQMSRFHASNHVDLTDLLGKVARLQKDQVATKASREISPRSGSAGDLAMDLRLLMARIAVNASREKEALAIVARTGIEDDISEESIEFLKAALSWHFENEDENQPVEKLPETALQE